MKLYLLVVVALVSLVAPAVVQGRPSCIKKKRSDDCPIKSQDGDILKLHYTGKLEDGTVFSSSVPRNEPFEFTLGKREVIEGWEKGLKGMCEGEKRTLVIPPEDAYGDEGIPPKIPGGATLTFEIELLRIKRKLKFVR